MSVRFSILAMAGCWTCSTSDSAFCDKPRAWRSSFKGISASISCALASTRSLASGDIFARSSSNFLAIDQALLSKLFQVRVVQAISHRNIHVIPAIVSGLVSTDQQNRRASRIA
ncbi:hypothetical protein D9M70_647190 [compost metagenome]